MKGVHQYIDRVNLGWDNEDEPFSSRNVPAIADETVDRGDNGAMGVDNDQVSSVPNTDVESPRIVPNDEDNKLTALSVGDQVSESNLPETGTEFRSVDSINKDEDNKPQDS